MAKNINHLTVNEVVTLKFNGAKSLGNETYTDEAVFLGIDGSGDDRNANFDSNGTKWSAYRMTGKTGWFYGSSAERLTVAQN